MQPIGYLQLLISGFRLGGNQQIRTGLPSTGWRCKEADEEVYSTSDPKMVSVETEKDVLDLKELQGSLFMFVFKCLNYSLPRRMLINGVTPFIPTGVEAEVGR